MKRLAILLALCLIACGEKEPPKPPKPLVTCEGFKDVPRDCLPGVKPVSAQ